MYVPAPAPTRRRAQTNTHPQMSARVVISVWARRRVGAMGRYSVCGSLAEGKTMALVQYLQFALLEVIQAVYKLIQGMYKINLEHKINLYN